SIANDAFILFIEDKLKDFDIKFTKIAQGVPTGVSLENVDILSLSKAIQSKVEI
ncbi:recombination protein RecR, partial [Aliarcobacter butzleri]|nr:recombination protein RecR [Aliarcobacter butzleri]